MIWNLFTVDEWHLILGAALFGGVISEIVSGLLLLTATVERDADVSQSQRDDFDGTLDYEERSARDNDDTDYEAM